MKWLAAPGLWEARFLVTRLLGVLFVIAFTNAWLQFPALLGERGLLPAPAFLARTTWRTSPSLFRLGYSDRRLRVVAGTGAILAGTVVLGLVQSAPAGVGVAVWLVLFGLYLSIVNVGQVFYAFGWESILLEAGFLAAFLGPESVAPTWPAMLLVRWLLFRIEVGAGLIKLRGDPCWRDLTCLEYHHETQPLPGPLSWQAHRLPRWWHRVETGGNHVVQLIVPFGLFLPQPVAGVAAALILVTQGWLVVTGNFAWLNAVTMVLALSALPGAWLGWLPGGHGSLGVVPPWFALLVLAITVGSLLLSWRPVRNMASRRQRMNVTYNPLHLVGSYGAFGTVTRTRYEIILEGTADPDPATAAWIPYEFKGKPGALDRRPPQIAPYHLRLDWMMWFAAFTPRPTERWFLRLVDRLLEGDPATLGLLRRNPFAGDAPRFVRARRFVYELTPRDERRRSGRWWRRREIGEYMAPVGG